MTIKMTVPDTICPECGSDNTDWHSEGPGIGDTWAHECFECNHEWRKPMQKDPELKVIEKNPS